MTSKKTARRMTIVAAALGLIMSAFGATAANAAECDIRWNVTNPLAGATYAKCTLKSAQETVLN